MRHQNIAKRIKRDLRLKSHPPELQSAEKPDRQKVGKRFCIQMSPRINSNFGMCAAIQHHIRLPCNMELQTKPPSFYTENYGFVAVKYQLEKSKNHIEIQSLACLKQTALRAKTKQQLQENCHTKGNNTKKEEEFKAQSCHNISKIKITVSDPTPKRY